MSEFECKAGPIGGDTIMKIIREEAAQDEGHVSAEWRMLLPKEITHKNKIYIIKRRNARQLGLARHEIIIHRSVKGSGNHVHQRSWAA